MTYPRSQLVSSDQPGFYHCHSRCVRRSFLCGKDSISGKDYEHRRQWLETLMAKHAKCFAVSIYSYCIMHNHFHIALYLDPTAPLEWEPEEVARRWLTVFPGLLNGANTKQEREEVVRTLAEDQHRISELRVRLGNLGWFMRSISQPVARRANIEDECTGRFWEGRFKVQALLDERAALSCMAYIDLNPIRAKICHTLAECAHTSIKARLHDHRHQIEANGSVLEQRITPVFDGLGPRAGDVLSITAVKYIELTQWTGEQLWPSKGGHFLPALTADSDDSLSDKQKAWLRQVRATESAYARAIGSVEALLRKARHMNQAWLKGIRFARTMPTSQAST